jgi:hypothetical protein
MSASANTGNPVFRLGRYPGNGRGPKSVRKLKGIADPSDGDRDCRSPLDNTGACFALGFKLTHYRPRRGCATCAARPQPRARINPLRSKEPAQRAGPNAHQFASPASFCAEQVFIAAMTAALTVADGPTHLSPRVPELPESQRNCRTRPATLSLIRCRTGHCRRWSDGSVPVFSVRSL